MPGPPTHRDAPATGLFGWTLSAEPDIRKRPETTFYFQAKIPNEILQDAQSYSWTRPKLKRKPPTLDQAGGLCLRVPAVPCASTSIFEPAFAGGGLSGWFCLALLQATASPHHEPGPHKSSVGSKRMAHHVHSRVQIYPSTKDSN